MKRVLVVEDEAVIRALIEASLEGDFELATAADGFGALESLHSFHPDIVLLDIGLPGMNGLDVLRRIRSDCELAQTPVVLITGREPPEAVRAEAVLAKPFTPANLRDSLQRWLT